MASTPNRVNYLLIILLKIGDKLSEWLSITKGDPQGSIMGPFAYNIFTNDLLLAIAIKPIMYLCSALAHGDDVNLTDNWGLFIIVTKWI